MAKIDSKKILQGLGGADNISSIEGCITRLRVEIEDSSQVNEEQLREAGAMGVVIAGEAVQVVVGPAAEMIAEDIEDYL